ncbi:MAG: hypothetical protein WHX93_17625 [bacterium]
MRETVWLGNLGSCPYQQVSPPEPMYKALSEVLGIIKEVIEEKGLSPLGHFRTLESGVFEEHVVFLKAPHSKKLLFRMWPLLFTHQRRLEYKIYRDGEPLRQEIMPYLEAYAQINRAELIPKA